MTRSQHLVIVFIVAALGIALFLYKALVLQFPLSPDSTTTAWNIEAAISFNASGKSAKVSAFIPKNTRHFAIVDENFISRGFGLTTSIEEGNRRAEWSIRKASGKHTLFYRALVRQLSDVEGTVGSKLPEIPAPGFDEAETVAARTLLSDAQLRSADLLTLVRALAQDLQTQPLSEPAALLLGKNSSLLTQLVMATRILALDGIPARVAHGIRLEDTKPQAPFIHWLEVHDKKQWVTLDSQGNKSGDDETLLPWWKGELPVGAITGGSNLNIKVAVSRHQEGAVEAAVESTKMASPVLLQLSLFSLPLHTQAVFRVMLLIPLGALLLVLLRNVVGLPTFGTFMPVLVALAFRETDIVMGCFFFTIIVALGLIVRFWLEKMRLLMVPRLAAVLTVVVLLLALTAIISHKFGIETGLSIALFPMVILTMTIERMSIIWDELGPSDALKQGVGSLIAAVLTTLLMTQPLVEHLLFVFPELLLIVLALCLLLGRYTGYRLTELRRFRALVGER